jgi:arylsulfatase A
MKALLAFAWIGLGTLAATCRAEEPARPPNVVIVFADDLGYGDLGCYGATAWKTPHLDRLAREGVRFTSFYVAQPVCSASRAALLTGCYPNRLGIHGALPPTARHGLHPEETTLAEVLQAKGYATACIGKWHLGHLPAFLPTRHGFDIYFGLPYSNDMWPHHPERKDKPGYPPLPLYDGDRVLIADVTPEHQAQLTQWYTERAVAFIQRHKDRPFFLYLAHNMPHVPLFVSEKYRGSSGAGLYGDVIQEVDASVGAIMEALSRFGLERDTLILFSSDNGPWLSYGNHGGSAGGLREGKGTVWEGGVRVPLVARWPARIPPGSVCTEPAMTIDLLPTLAALCAAPMPARGVDGKDITDLLLARPGSRCPHEAYYFYYGLNELQAVRAGRWKLVLPHTYRTMQGQQPGRDGKPGQYRQVRLAEPQLYDLESDPGETTDLAAREPEIVRRFMAYVEQAREDLGDALTKRQGKNLRQPGRASDIP